MNSVSDRLKNKIELAKPSMQEAANALWNADDAREIYPLYLEQMHMVVRSGVSLMQTAINTARQLPSSCLLKTRVIDYLEKHIEEENGHDFWLLEDYESTGNDADHLLSKIPSCHVACMAGAGLAGRAGPHRGTMKVLPSDRRSACVALRLATWNRIGRV